MLMLTDCRLAMSMEYIGCGLDCGVASVDHDHGWWRWRMEDYGSEKSCLKISGNTSVSTCKLSIKKNFFLLSGWGPFLTLKACFF
jgi:hypothetical protein